MAENNTPLNIEKVISFIKEDIFSKEYHCPYTDAAIVWKLSESYMKSMI